MAHGLHELKFAVSYPFSRTAQAVVRSSGVSMDSIPESVVEKARARLLSGLLGKPVSRQIAGHTGLLEEEVLAFPVAKMLISFTNNQHYFEKFAESVAVQSYNSLVRDMEERPEILFDIAQELGAGFDITESGMVSVPLAEYLSYPKSFPELRLQNQKLEKGSVFLSRSEFAKLLREAIAKKVLASIPIPTKEIPKQLALVSREAVQEHSKSQAAAFKKAGLGKVSVDSFPPCFSELYSSLSSGNKLSHIGNFTLAVFLVAIGMPRERVMGLYSKAPNFEERTASYHIDRLFGFKGGKKYTPASCETMRSYSLCIENGALCSGIKSPMQYYRRGKRSENAVEEKKQEAEKSEKNEKKPGSKSLGTEKSAEGMENE